MNPKKEQLKEAKSIASRNNIRIISSNPCFEVWYLEHFGYSSKFYNSSGSVISELRKHIPDYRKNTCDFETLYPHTEQAIRNCEKLDDHHRAYGLHEMFEFSNPRTDVYKIVRLITDLDNKQA